MFVSLSQSACAQTRFHWRIICTCKLMVRIKLPEKEGVRINRVLEILQYFSFLCDIK